MKEPLLDISGLAGIFGVDKSTLYKSWKELPHVFVVGGRNAKSARFYYPDVAAYLKQRDYTKGHKDAIQRWGHMDGGVSDRIEAERSAPAKKEGISYKNSGKKMGKGRKRKIPEPTSNTPACILDFERKHSLC